MIEKWKLAALVCLLCSAGCSSDRVTTVAAKPSLEQGSGSMPEATLVIAAFSFLATGG